MPRPIRSVEIYLPLEYKTQRLPHRPWVEATQSDITSRSAAKQAPGQEQWLL
jgi:hypothetical protein